MLNARRHPADAWSVEHRTTTERAFTPVAAPIASTDRVECSRALSTLDSGSMRESFPPTKAFGSLLAALRRALGALAASVLGALAAGACSGALHVPADRVGGAVREAALFVPLGALVALLLVPLALAFPAHAIRRVLERLAGNGARIRTSSAWLLVLPSATVVWIALAARAGRFFMTAFHHVGLAALAQAVALAALTAMVLAAAAGIRTALVFALHQPLSLRFAPAFSLALGVALATVLLVVGIETGTTEGRGSLLGAYGVLKKPELDLSPAYGAAGVIGAALLLYVLTVRTWARVLSALALALGLSAGLVRHAALHFADASSAAVIEARPSLARGVLRALRKRIDRDHDGASALFGGGDCDDRDRRRNPDARDLPGNGVDEDCSGRDAPLAPPPPPPPPPSLIERLRRETPAEMNLVLITVDTLRWDTHYAGNPREISPNLDRLAARSVVFDRGYALSSYTGRAIGPMMAGRYPTECARDSNHFTSYHASNVMLAERLRAAGFRTMGAASHFYFQRRYGLAQGVEIWDTSAEPSSHEQETVSTDARVADRAIAMLRAQAGQPGRFFLWTHFFDPHKQYVPHPELPSFGNGERARYEGEVAWTDRQIGRLLDALAELPFAERTIVVVTSDHGEAFGEHGMSWHGIELWEELVRVPWIIYVPGLAPRHVTLPRSQIDLLPTLLELLRLPLPPRGAPDALSGTSLVPDLLGEPLPPRPIYIDLPEGPFNSMRRSIIEGGWKLIERGARRFELYHLESDPGEHVNVAAREPEQLARMRALMEQVRSSLREIPAAGEPR